MLQVKEGDEVVRGQALSDGPIDITELFTLAGRERVQYYILNEVSRVYTLQGATINNKHIEMVARQMFSRVRIKDPGDTRFSVGEVIEYPAVLDENEQVEATGGAPAKTSGLLMGITRVALTTNSFLSAASFMETSRVLIKAALEGREDKLLGLKENVIIGRLIPAGTGFRGMEMGEEEFEEEEAE